MNTYLFGDGNDDLRAGNCRESIIRLGYSDEFIRGRVVSSVFESHLLDDESSIRIHDSSRGNRAQILIDPSSTSDILLSWATVPHFLGLSLDFPVPLLDSGAETELELLANLKTVLHDGAHCTADKSSDENHTNHPSSLP
ncbi:hypothetical protein PFISCL1PPCAC_24586, partial [Pristionchus fissidentatus]